MSYQLISKNKNEMSKSIKGSIIIKLIKSAHTNQEENIYNLGYGNKFKIIKKIKKTIIKLLHLNRLPNLIL